MAKANPIRFSTKYQDDESDLLYYGYRFYKASTGTWMNRDQYAERGGADLYEFCSGDPKNKHDAFGLSVMSAGFAFRDPLQFSIGDREGSGFSFSASAWYAGWGSPFLHSICNSGNVGYFSDYPPFRTSFVQAWMSPGLLGCSGSTKRYHVTCHAALVARVWGRIAPENPQFTTQGQMLGEPIDKEETTTFPLGTGQWLSVFHKTLSKDITVNGAYYLYTLYMPVAVQVLPMLQGGFAEAGRESCEYSEFGAGAMHRLRKFILGFAALAALTALAVTAYRSQYPYGVRPCCLPCVLQALREFAEGHSGGFPDGGRNSRDALAMLYPHYLVDRPLLAGISGDRKLLEQEMSVGSGISEPASSWVYWPGFTLDDDPNIAIIWERQDGIQFNGRRSPGHAVGFISGDMRQVKDDEWESFLSEQKLLRQNARARQRHATDKHLEPDHQP